MADSLIFCIRLLAMLVVTVVFTLPHYSIADSRLAVNDLYITEKDSLLTVSAPGVLDNDTGGDALTVELLSDVGNGVLALDSEGSFTYQPDSGFAGTDTFTYRLINGTADSDQGLVTIHVLSSGGSPSLPNVIIVLVDDLGQGDLPIYNSGSAIETPNLDALANAGMRFINAHAPAAVCSPSRYSILTGNYPYRARNPNGIWNAFDPDTMILPGQQTIGNVMQGAGYQTAFIGKLNNGGAYWNSAGTKYTENLEDIDFTRSFDRGPTQFGFDYSFVMPNGLGKGLYAYFENDRIVRQAGDSNDFFAFAINQDVRDSLVAVERGQTFNGGKVGQAGYAMDNYDSRQIGPLMTYKALEFIDDNFMFCLKNGTLKPFFLYLALPALHYPNTPPLNFNSDEPKNVEHGNDPNGVPIKGVTPISSRTDMVYETDVVIGELVSKLNQQGFLNKTIIIFASDNGVVRGKHWTGPNQTGDRIETGPDGTRHINAQGVQDGKPLRASKGHIYEGGHRVPFIVRWGDGSSEGSLIEPGSTSTQIVGLQDLMATFAALTGERLVEDQAMDSYNLLPAMLGQQPDSQTLRDHLIVQGSVQKNTASKLDRAFYERDSESGGDLWKLTVSSKPNDQTRDFQSNELFNLTIDPGETNDLSHQPEQQQRFEEMTARYIALVSQDRTAPLPPPSNNMAPVAVTGENQAVEIGETVILNGAESYDADGDTLSYFWDFVEVPIGSGALLSDIASPTPTFVPDLAGDYRLELVVNDGELSSAPSTVLIQATDTGGVPLSVKYVFDGSQGSVGYTLNATDVTTGTIAVQVRGYENYPGNKVAAEVHRHSKNGLGIAFNPGWNRIGMDEALVFDWSGRKVTITDCHVFTNPKLSKTSFHLYADGQFVQTVSVPKNTASEFTKIDFSELNVKAHEFAFVGTDTKGFRIRVLTTRLK